MIPVSLCESPDIDVRTTEPSGPGNPDTEDPLFPIGAPIVGWVADTFGPRWALGVGAASGFAAAVVVVIYLWKYCDLRLRLESGRLSLRMNSR